ncbi:unnamed protein product [Oikopleura dioica]|uniref:Uncharacterized protein n=1 Tax=Oikopleura dioica TaxID=34765 RepID=E4Y5S6_OIKDI|nr:unnamed protein product [Oikopleura dioica]
MGPSQTWHAESECGSHSIYPAFTFEDGSGCGKSSRKQIEEAKSDLKSQGFKSE